jgi:antitoxin PrlF
VYNPIVEDEIKKMANNDFVTQVGKGGRITVPVKMRKALQIDTGDAVLLRLAENGIQVIPLHLAVQLAQKKVRQYIPAGTPLADELIASRREEAAHE